MVYRQIKVNTNKTIINIININIPYIYAFSKYINNHTHKKLFIKYNEIAKMMMMISS